MIHTQRGKPKFFGFLSNSLGSSSTFKSKMSSIHLLAIMSIFWLSFVIGKSSSTDDNSVDIGLSAVPDGVVAIDQGSESSSDYLSLASSYDYECGLEDGDFDDLLDDQEWEMVTRKGNQFVILPTSAASKQQGTVRPIYVNGFNTYWLMLFASDESTKGKVSQIFQEASSVGLTVCRTWAFNDGGWKALQKSPGVYDENIFKALDFVLSEAKKYKIRVIMSFWESYGGKSQYVKLGKDFSGLTNLTSDDDFFTHPTLRTMSTAEVVAVLCAGAWAALCQSRAENCIHAPGQEDQHRRLKQNKGHHKQRGYIIGNEISASRVESYTQSMKQHKKLLVELPAATVGCVLTLLWA